jgi:hypothetical protein
METTQNPQEIKEIQEMTIAIAANSFTPNIINPEFLRLSGVIPQDWQLAREPIVNPGLVQLVFQNRVSIVGQQNIVTFIENFGTEPVKELLISDLAKRFVEKLPNADYQSVGFGPKSVIPIKLGGMDAGRKFITNTLLAPGPWQDIGKAPVKASLNLQYQLDRCQLNIAINEATIQMADQSTIPAVLFAGNFNYSIAQADPSMRLNALYKSIEHWDLDLALFRELIEQRFFVSNNSIFPSSFTMG